MLRIIGGWIGSVLIVAYVLGIIVVNLIRLIKALQCRKIKDRCENMKCKTRGLCSKYDNRKEILNLRIEVIKRQMETEK